MPAAPHRADDDLPVPPTRAEHPQPRPVRSADPDEPGASDPRSLARRSESRAPALEGLTATGAGVVGLVVTTLAAVLDAVLSPGLGWIFFVAFFVMSAFVGLRLRGRDVWASAAVPPLVFIGAAGLAAQVAPATGGGWLQRTSGDMAVVVLDHPYVLMIGTSLAVVAIGYRAFLD